jgi:hypothetical protein
MSPLFLVQCRGEMAVLPAVAAVLLHRSVMHIWSECCVFSTGYRKIADMHTDSAVLIQPAFMEESTDCSFLSTW